MQKTPGGYKKYNITNYYNRETRLAMKFIGFFQYVEKKFMSLLCFILKSNRKISLLIIGNKQHFEMY